MALAVADDDKGILGRDIAAVGGDDDGEACIGQRGGESPWRHRHGVDNANIYCRSAALSGSATDVKLHWASAGGAESLQDRPARRR